MSLRSRIAGAFKAFAEVEAKPVDTTKGEVAVADLVTTSMFGKNGKWTIYNPSELISRRGYGVIDKMRMDEQIKSAMTFKKRTVNASGWEVVSPESKPQDWEVTEFVKDALTKMRGTLNGAINEMLLALDYGFSPTEKIWEERDGKTVIAELKTRRPHNIYFDLDSFGNVVALRQFNDELPIDKFIIFTYDREFQNPYGVSDLTAAYRPWWSKDNAYKWLAILLERMGIPPIFMFYNPDSQSGANLSGIQTVLKRLQASTVATIPRAKKEDVEPWAPELAGNATNVFIPSIDMYDRHIAKAVLMPGLLGFSADEAQGSLARSQTHFDSFMLVVSAIRQMLQDPIIQEQIVKPMVDVNFAGVAEYPQFRLLPISDETKLEIFDTWSMLVGGKIVRSTDDDEQHIRAALKFPEREYVEGEREEMNKPPEPPMIPGQKEEGEKDEQLKSKKDQDSDENRDAEDYSLKHFASKHVKRIDYKAIGANMGKLEDDIKAELTSAVDGVRERITKWVDKNYGADDFDPTKFLLPSSLGTQRIFGPALQQAIEMGSTTARGEITVVKNYAKAGSRPKQLPGETTKRATKYLKQKATVVADKFDQKVQDAVRMALLNGLKTGDSNKEVMKRVNDALDLVDDTYAENVVRTNITEAVNLGRLSEFRDPEMKPFIVAVQYSAILDNRTTEVCSFLDGKIFHVDDSALDEFSPPNHYQCRSLLVPVFVDEEPKEDEYITETEKGKARDLAGEGFV